MIKAIIILSGLATICMLLVATCISLEIKTPKGEMCRSMRFLCDKNCKNCTWNTEEDRYE